MNTNVVGRTSGDIALDVHPRPGDAAALPAVRSALLASPLFKHSKLAHDPALSGEENVGDNLQTQLQLDPLQLVLMWLNTCICKIWDTKTVSQHCAVLSVLVVVSCGSEDLQR